MAQVKRKKLRVSLHGMRNRIDAIDKSLAKRIKTVGPEKQAKMQSLRRTLRQVRSALSNECCDSAWYCEF